MAAAGFRTRRVKTEGVSIGDRLKRARTRRKLSIAEVEDATRIRSKFLLALESDSWDQIPSEVYGRGYLETYAVFLKMPAEEIMRDYDKMRTVYARHCKEGHVELAPRTTISFPKFTLTPKFLLMCVLGLGLAGFVSVIGVQLRAYAATPFLQLAMPDQGGPGLAVSTDSVNVTGRTVPGAVVHVNGQLAEVTTQGDFNYKLGVQKGVNPVVVESMSQNGRKTSEVTSIVVK
jgi:cytoskeletal protein RodZ